MTRREHEEFAELAVGFALHALEPEDEVRFAHHLGSCAACERAVVEHRETLVHLAHAAPPADPPAALLQGIRAAIAAEEATAPVADLARARQRRSVSLRRSWVLSAAAGVTAVVLGLGAWNAALQEERDAARDSLSQTVAALEAAGGTTVPLRTEDGEVLAVAVMRDGEMSVVVDGLAANPDDTVYVLWGRGRAGGVRAVATFDVAQDDLHVVDGVAVVADTSDVDTLMLTREPGGTVPPVSTQPVLVSGDV